MSSYELQWLGKTFLHKLLKIFSIKGRISCTHRSNLNGQLGHQTKHKPSFQELLYSHPGSCPARLGTAEWRLEGRRSCESGEEVNMNQWDMSRRKAKEGTGAQKAGGTDEGGRRTEEDGELEKGGEENRLLFHFWFGWRNCLWGHTLVIQMSPYKYTDLIYPPHVSLAHVTVGVHVVKKQLFAPRVFQSG